MVKTKVLIAIDESAWAQNAFDWYVDNVHHPDNEVICFHSIEPPFIQGDPLTTTADMYDAAVSACKLNARQLEERYAEKMKTHKINGKIVAKISNNAGQLIVDKAAEENVHLIVIGTRGLGKIRRTVLGSVSSHVVHHAHCPVTVCNHSLQQAEHK